MRTRAPWVLTVAVGWMLPFASGTGLVPAAAGAILIGVRVARMSDQAWAEGFAGRARTKRAKAPKMAVESAA